MKTKSNGKTSKSAKLNSGKIVGAPVLRRFVAYRVGKKSGKALESRAFKTEHMARNFASYWRTLPKCDAFVCVHECHTDPFGIVKYGASFEIEQ